MSNCCTYWEDNNDEDTRASVLNLSGSKKYNVHAMVNLKRKSYWVFFRRVGNPIRADASYVWIM